MFLMDIVIININFCEDFHTKSFKNVDINSVLEFHLISHDLDAKYLASFIDVILYVRQREWRHNNLLLQNDYWIKWILSVLQNPRWSLCFYFAQKNSYTLFKQLYLHKKWKNLKGEVNIYIWEYTPIFTPYLYTFSIIILLIFFAYLCVIGCLKTFRCLFANWFSDQFENDFSLTKMSKH